MGTQPARTGWLYQLPPWRAPRIRRHHHHHHSVAGGFGSAIGWMLFAAIFLEIWCAEFALWMTVWTYYGLFLGTRWVWRHNPIGQTIDSLNAAKERRRPVPYDPHSAPPTRIDLSTFDQQP